MTDSPLPGSRTIRLAILQRVITGYRASLFRKLSAVDGLQVRLFHGQSLPDSKVTNARDLSGLDRVELPTRWLTLGHMPLAMHKGLRKALAQFDPDVLITEGESNLLSMRVGLSYAKSRHKPILHWSLGFMPGVTVGYAGLGGWIKKRYRSRFDGFITYSSYGRDAMVRAGHPADRITVAVNVSDTEKHLAAADALGDMTRQQARAKLGLAEAFTTLYVGAVDATKRLEHWLEAAASVGGPLNVVIVGDGPSLEPLRARAAGLALPGFCAPGRVTEGLATYYRAADVLVLPGRGGMVISEAMAHALPVIVYQADGTEYDLVQDGVTGIRLADGDAGDIAAAIGRLRQDPATAARMGQQGQDRLRTRFSQAAMVQALHQVLGRATAA